MQKLLYMEDIVKPGESTSKLRPKPADCCVKVEGVTASWTEVCYYSHRISNSFNRPFNYSTYKNQSIIFIVQGSERKKLARLMGCGIKSMWLLFKLKW